MPKRDDVTVIKKYANRRLYNTSTSTYVTLENLATMVKHNEEFTVQDARTGEDITHSVLTQIIFEQENKGGQNLMPITFLRQLIRFYGDQMQMAVPGFLEHSMSAFSKEQEKFRSQVTDAVSTMPIAMMEAQVRRNTEMFRQAMAVFNPFLAKGGEAGGETGDSNAAGSSQLKGGEGEGELKAMREQLAAMERRIAALDGGKKD